MIRTMTAVLLGAAALGFAAPGFAAPAAAEQGKFIHPADTNKDQKISKAEWTAFKSFAPEQFAKADANKDGGVDGPEFVTWDSSGRGGKPAS